MQITKIQYSKTVESNVMGAGIWQKIGVDAVVSEGEDIAAAIDEARNVVEDAHRKYLPEQPIFLSPQEKKNEFEALKKEFNVGTK